MPRRQCRAKGRTSPERSALGSGKQVLAPVLRPHCEVANGNKGTRGLQEALLPVCPPSSSSLGVPTVLALAWRWFARTGFPGKM